MSEIKESWELTERDYLHICDTCKSDCDLKDSDINEGCEFYHECLVEVGQIKLLQFLKLHDKSLDELFDTLKNLYENF